MKQSEFEELLVSRRRVEELNKIIVNRMQDIIQYLSDVCRLHCADSWEFLEGRGSSYGRNHNFDLVKSFDDGCIRVWLWSQNCGQNGYTKNWTDHTGRNIEINVGRTGTKIPSDWLWDNRIGWTEEQKHEKLVTEAKSKLSPKELEALKKEFGK